MSSVIAYPPALSSVLDFKPKPADRFSITGTRYLIRMALSKEEVDSALRLRFAVFNIELGLGMARSYVDGRDADSFDDYGEHIILIDRALNRIVGTCRLTKYPFSSSINFDLGQLPSNLLDSSLEVSRVCLAKSHRNKTCLLQLWEFIVEYASRNGKRYLFGCCSLKSQDPLLGGQLFEALKNRGNVHSTLRVIPRPGAKCLFYKMPTLLIRQRVSSNFRTYLKLGAKICGMPAIDRAFGTIEFFALLDLKS